MRIALVLPAELPDQLTADFLAIAQNKVPVFQKGHSFRNKGLRPRKGIWGRSILFLVPDATGKEMDHEQKHAGSGHRHKCKKPTLSRVSFSVSFKKLKAFEMKFVDANGI